MCIFFQARTVFVLLSFFSSSFAIISLLEKAKRSQSFKEVTGRCYFFFFKEVHLVSN